MIINRNARKAKTNEREKNFYGIRGLIKFNLWLGKIILLKLKLIFVSV